MAAKSSALVASLFTLLLTASIATACKNKEQMQ
jgi:hypothetical protein